MGLNALMKLPEKLSTGFYPLLCRENLVRVIIGFLDVGLFLFLWRFCLYGIGVGSKIWAVLADAVPFLLIPRLLFGSSRSLVLFFVISAVHFVWWWTWMWGAFFNSLHTISRCRLSWFGKWRRSIIFPDRKPSAILKVGSSYIQYIAFGDWIYNC